MARYQWIIFDADNTLYDFDRAQSAALTVTLTILGLPAEAAVHQRYAEISRKLWQQFEQGEINAAQLRVIRFRELLEDLGSPHSPEEASQRYLQNLGRERPLMEGAREVVEAVARECQMILATNGFSEVQRQRFSDCPLRPYFEDLVISEEIGYAKPQTGFFEEVFRRMSHPQRSQVLIVGDSLESDIAGGRAYEIDTCWFMPGEREAEMESAPVHRIRSLPELLPLLDDA